MEAERVKEALEKHLKWLRSEEGGVRANLARANLETIRQEFTAILDAARDEVPGLYDALKRGRINGSLYEGECCCLKGTIANLRECVSYDRQRISGVLSKDPASAPERWFLPIRPGDTEESSQVVCITCHWIREWAISNDIELPRYKIVSSTEMPSAFVEN